MKTLLAKTIRFVASSACLVRLMLKVHQVDNRDHQVPADTPPWGTPRK